MTSESPPSQGSAGSLRVLIACGGTGGHLFPGVAVAETLLGRGHEVAALISRKNVDTLATQGYGHIRFERVEAIAMPRLLSPAMVPFAWRFWKTLRECRRIVAEFRPDVVLGMGGFTSMPPIMAGRRYGARTFIHESNAVPGKANRMTARFCSAVLVGFEECAPCFRGRKVLHVGTPVRAELDRRPSPDEARRAFGLEPGRRTLLVMGGSQGARGVNRAVCEALPHLQAGEVQVIHITGTADFDEVRAAYAAVPFPHHVEPFCDEMGKAYAAADLAISRSGASSLAELAYCGVPAILVPYPYAADDHQLRNAEIFAAASAALLIEEKNLTGKSLSKMINELAFEPECLRRLAENAGRLSFRDAAGRVADVLLSPEHRPVRS